MLVSNLLLLANLADHFKLDRNAIYRGRDTLSVRYWISQIDLDGIPVGDSRDTDANIGDKEILGFVLRGASLLKSVTHAPIIRST